MKTTGCRNRKGQFTKCHHGARGGRAVGAATYQPGPAVPGVRVFDQGSEVRVTADDRFVHDWTRRWPSSGMWRLSSRGVSFTFDKNGDLLDYSPSALQHADQGAVLALADDLQKIAWARLGLH